MQKAGRNRFTVAATLLLAAALSTGCGAAAQPAGEVVAGGPAAAGASSFTIRNNHEVGRDMVIYLEPEGRGERQTLGTVAAGATATLNHVVPRGYYWLIAAHNLGEIKSDRFNVPVPSNVTWTMAPSRVVVAPR